MTKGKIIHIRESVFKSEGGLGEYEGYEIITDKQIIQLGIYSGQPCCENYGYLMSNDSTDEFIGATLKGVSLTDIALNNSIWKNMPDEDYTDTMFVNIETSKGLLQFVAYNSHNGYYGHSVIVKSTQLTHNDIL